MLEALTDDLTNVIHLLDLVFVLIVVFFERESPYRALFWSLVLIVFPIAGFVLYLFFGQTFYLRRNMYPLDAPEDVIERMEEDAKEGIGEDSRSGKGDTVMAEALYRAGARNYSSDNAVRLYTDGNEKFDDLKRDIEAARRYIHIEYYIIRNDALGNEIVDILARKAREGVKVRLLSDAIGYNTRMKRTLELVEAGGKVAVFHSILTVLLSPRKNNRNHRKIAVIDGEIGYIGGFNIGVEYLGKGKFGRWRDSAVRLEGSSVKDLSLRFALDWEYASHEKIAADRRYYEHRGDRSGDVPVQIVSGGPDMRDRNAIAFQYLMMIEAARKTLYIHTPYLAPNEACMYALRSAAMRGVDVRIIMPSIADHPFVFWTNRKNADTLMRDGVRVFEYRDGFVHSKTIVSDGRLCSVGSANLDGRSMALNFEADAMIYSEEVGREMADAFMRDLDSCTEYTREMYAHRTLMQRLRTGLSWLVSSLLRRPRNGYESRATTHARKKVSRMDRQTVERVARNAHIRLTDEELDRYSKDLSDILGYFELLDEAPGSGSSGIDPIGVADILRDDEPKTEFDADELLAGMNTYERYVRGPRLS